jgi:hypothetical protein
MLSLLALCLVLRDAATWQVEKHRIEISEVALALMNFSRASFLVPQLRDDFFRLISPFLGIQFSSPAVILAVALLALRLHRWSARPGSWQAPSEPRPTVADQ